MDDSKITLFIRFIHAPLFLIYAPFWFVYIALKDCWGDFVKAEIEAWNVLVYGRWKK